MSHAAKLTTSARISLLVRTGLLAAMICLLTTVFHIPTFNGYIHCGDAMIYLAAATLPLPYAMAAAAIGGAMSDLLTGYVMYILPTFLIKALLALVFHCIGGDALVCGKRILGTVLCGIVSMVGYWITAVILYGGWKAQFVGTIPGNAMQALGSALVYCAVAAAVQKGVQFKKQ